MRLVHRFVYLPHFQVDIQVYFLLGALPLDDDSVQNGGHQSGVDPFFEGQLLFQRLSDLVDLQAGGLALLLLGVDGVQLSLKLRRQLVEAVVALFLFRHGQASLHAQFQQAIFFCVHLFQFLLDASARLAVIHVPRHALQDGHQ